MKITKTSVHRLTIEKTCGCQATREYEDVRYTKPIAEAQFSACPKHNKGPVAEFAADMLIEALDKEAETAGKTAFVSFRQVAEGDTGGLVATAEVGGSVQAMGVNMPKRREPRDPLKQSTLIRPAPTGPRPQNTGNLNMAHAEDLTPEELEEAGITMTGDIDGVPADPNVDDAVTTGLSEMSDYLDAQDAKEQGVPLRVLNAAE